MCDICWKKYCVDGDKYLLINMALNTWKQWSLCLVAILCVWLDGQNWRTYFTTTSINIYIPQLMFRCFFNRMMHHGTFFQGILNIFQPSLSSHGIPSSWAISRDITRSSDSTFWFGSRPPQKDLAVCIPSFVAGILMINGFFIQCCFQIQYPFQMDRVPNSWYLHIYQWLPYYTRADNFISSWFLLPPPMFGIAG